MDDNINAVQVEDGENFSGGTDALGIKQIALEQYRRCCIEGSKEMTKAGSRIKIIRGVPVKVEIPDQREIFVNSVKSMEIVLSPEIDRWDDLKDKLSEINVIINDLHNGTNEKYNKFKKKYNENNNLDWEKSTEDIFLSYGVEIVNLFRRKLIIFSQVLKRLHYYDEQSASGG